MIYSYSPNLMDFLLQINILTNKDKATSIG